MMRSSSLLAQGVSLLELLLVIGIMAVVGAVTIPSSQTTVTSNQITSEAKLVAQRLVQLSIDARVSGRTIRLDCTATGITSTAFNKNQTYDYASAAAGISGLTSVESTIVKSTSSNLSLLLSCPTTQTFFISSEGYFFQNNPANTGFTLSLTAGSYSAQIQMSAAGYPRVFIGSQTLGSNHEI